MTGKKLGSMRVGGLNDQMSWMRASKNGPMQVRIAEEKEKIISLRLQILASEEGLELNRPAPDIFKALAYHLATKFIPRFSKKIIWRKVGRPESRSELDRFIAVWIREILIENPDLSERAACHILTKKPGFKGTKLDTMYRRYKGIKQRVLDGHPDFSPQLKNVFVARKRRRVGSSRP